jgi:probable F420-dependent oxidoreductase
MGNALEERGFESLWAPEHSHIPLTRKSGYPQGGDLPKKYYDVMDPFVTLTAAATVTKKLKVCTGICLVVQRDPIQTAKSVASLDQISKGRFLFGIGAGWNEDEMADHGTTDFKGRFKLMEERVQAMRAIWTQSKPDRARSGNPHHDVRHAGRARYAEALPGRRHRSRRLLHCLGGQGQDTRHSRQARGRDAADRLINTRRGGSTQRGNARLDSDGIAFAR